LKIDFISVIQAVDWYGNVGDMIIFSKNDQGMPTKEFFLLPSSKNDSLLIVP